MEGPFEGQVERADFAGLDAAYQKEYAYAQEMEAEMDAWNAKMGYGDNA